MENIDNFWGYSLNRLDVLKTREIKPDWQWTGEPKHRPGGRIAQWLDLFVAASDYLPTADEVTHYAPDIGTELERFNMAINTAFSHAFVRKFGISIEGVLFTLTIDEVVTIKETT